MTQNVELTFDYKT